MTESQLDSEDFLLKVRRYRRKVLEPAGLNFSRGRRRLGSHFPQHCIFEADSCVWKFYGRERARNARNTVKTSSRLRAEDIPTPRIQHADVHYNTMKEHGIGCIIMDRLEGGHFDPRDLMKSGSAIAPLLGRLHGLTAEVWGDLTWQPGGSNLEHFVEKTMARLLTRIQSLVSLADHPHLEGLEDWFMRKRPDWSLPDDEFQLVHGDLHESNLLYDTDGTLHLIDLDFSGYRVFALDLADLIQRNNTGVIPVDDPGTALQEWEDRARPFLEDYFRTVPEPYFGHWDILRAPCFLLVNLRAYLEDLQIASPQAAERRGVQLEGLLQQLHARRRLIDNLIRT